MARSAHNSSRIASPVGPFSHAVRVDGLVYLSGQVGQDPGTRQLVTGGIGDQTRQIFCNIRRLLEDLQLGFDDIVKVNVFLVSMKDFEEMNRVYAEHFARPYPVRTTVAVSELPLNASIEMEMIARARE